MAEQVKNQENKEEETLEDRRKSTDAGVILSNAGAVLTVVAAPVTEGARNGDPPKKER